MFHVEAGGATVPEAHVEHVVGREREGFAGASQAHEQQARLVGVELDRVKRVAFCGSVASAALERGGEGGCPRGHYERRSVV